MGKPVLDAAKRGEICGIISMGGSREAAARYVGCSPQTIYRTAVRDPEFRRQLRKAAGRAEVLQLKNISDAASCRQYWRAAAWMLERRFPKRYARRFGDRDVLMRLSRALASMVDLIVCEIDDAPLRQRILKRLREIAEQVAPAPRKPSTETSSP